MGTGGQYGYRHRRRYYTSYSNTDSDPSFLGTWLVKKIPADSTDLKEWLEKLKGGLEGKGSHPDSPWYDSVDMRAPMHDLYTEFTYIIDLDRNVFTLNGRRHIRLDAIPRGSDEDEWMKALSDGHPARILTLCPTVSPPEPRYLALYDESRASQTLSPISATAPYTFPTCGVLMDYFFRQLRFAYSPVLDNIDQYEPNHPDFQALAQAVLALSTWGHFHTGSRVPSSRQCPVTTIAPEWAATYMFEADTHFWHMSTLVILDIGLNDEQRLRSAVGRAIELWRAASKPEKNATAFIISLKSVVIVRFMDETVSHSAPIELCGAVTQTQPPFLALSHTPGFEILKRHFTPAFHPVNAALQRSLPVDVMERILDLCDDAALQTLSQTCKTVRALCLVRPRFSVGEYRLIYHVSENEFTALDWDGVSTSVVVGKVACAVPEPLPGGQGYNLVMQTKDDFYAVSRLMGLRCVSKAKFGRDAATLVETPGTDWRRKMLGEVD